ncbi:MAG: alpha/beta fold hydrolase [Xylophilus ampelinus]
MTLSSNDLVTGGAPHGAAAHGLPAAGSTAAVPAADPAHATPGAAARPAAADDAAAQSLLAACEARTERRVVTVAGRRLAWRRIGRGRPLVLVHGGHGNWMHWVRNLDALAATRTVWLPDLAGYGNSELPAGEPTLDGLVAATGAALDALVGADTAVDIAGFSFGGLVAAHLAAARWQRDPASVGRLALLGTAGHGGPRRNDLSGLVNWRRHPAGPERDADLRHNLGELMLSRGAQTDALALAVHRAACTATRFRSAALAAQPLLQPALARLGAPVLFLWGESDAVGIPSVTGPELVAGRPERRWEALPDAGHWVQYEQAEEVNRRLEDWFGGVA